MEVIRPESYRDQIYKMIKNKIINNGYADCEILNERKIAAELSVSRTPVREALKALEADGWVSYEPYKGAMVLTFGEQELKEVFQMRTALEGLMIELAIPKMTDNTLQELTHCIEKQHEVAAATPKDYEAFVELDLFFHGTLLDVCGNRMLKKAVTDLQDRIRRLGYHSLFRSDSRFIATICEHESILNAIKNKDVIKARADLESHLRKIYEAVAQGQKENG